MDRFVTLMLAGDVMTGRGIDQILAHPSEPTLYETFVTSALDYLRIAEEASGPIPRNVDPAYVWGDALAVLDQARPDLRIVNLETAVTTADQPWPKGINYRMNPKNIACLTAAGLDCCVLANNHVLDWGRDGLAETIGTLHDAGIATAGAGRNAGEAEAPAILPLPGGSRVLVYALASPSSGVPDGWAATVERSGVNCLAAPTPAAADRIAERIRLDREPGDIVVLSLHSGSNWGFDIGEADRALARRLTESGVDVFFGHSSHHAKAIEVHIRRPIFYGTGDFLNDYEGIGIRDPYRDDLVLMYLCRIALPDGRLDRLDMVPFRIRKFRLAAASRDDARWLQATMDRECRRFGGGVAIGSGNVLTLKPEPKDIDRS
jgi:poly-gamma-glutamate synthesis protein (capsule biosynthesis protein)